ncbi:MAG: hypothetical protein SO028_08530 [Prevotella sp.]|nr:hypothetical protein [Prevotella sp.]
MSAQKDVKGTTEFGINLGYDFGLQSGGGGFFSLQPEFGKHFSNQFYLGVGTGAYVDDKFNSVSIPAFVRAQVDFPMKGITPYVSLQGGYDFFTSGEGTGWGRINPSIGVKVPVSKNVDFNLGFGYTRTIMDGGGMDMLGFKAGLSFNSNGSGFSKFLKTLDYSVELEAHTPMTVTEKESNETNKNKCTNMIGARFSALAPLPVQNLYAGLSVGVGRYTEKDIWYTNDGRHSNYEESSIYLNAMARVKYKAKQIAIADRVYPFAQVDAGVDALYDAIFSVQPAVGVSIATKGDHSIDVSLGYATKRLDYEQNKGCMRIAVGYTF